MSLDQRKQIVLSFEQEMLKVKLDEQNYYDSIIKEDSDYYSDLDSGIIVI